MITMSLSNKFRSTIFFTVVLLFVTYLTMHYVGMENNIYYWDSNGYWRLWQQFSLGFSIDPVGTLSRLASSIKNDDYNLLPVAFTSLFYAFGGEGRLTYILSLSIVYLLPVSLLFSVLLKQFSEKQSVCWTIISLVLPATFVAFWAPTLRGYPDICGLIFVISAIIYTCKTDLSGKLNIKRAIILGAILWSPFLLRRWYAYTVISMYLSLPVLNYFIYNVEGHSFKKIFRIGTFFFISGIVSILLSIALQWNLLVRVATTDYSFIYSAYQSSVASSLYNVLHDIGLYIFPFFIISVVVSIFTKKTKEKYLVIFSLFNLVFSFFIFTKTQSPGLHHCLPFALWVLIASAISIKWFLFKLNSTVSKAIVVSFTIIICLIINKQSLFNTNINDFSKYFPTKYTPMRVDNYGNYVRLSSDIQSMLHNTEKLTVLSSSDVLNDNMLDTLSNLKLSKYLTGMSQVDLRDGLSIPALMSRFIIVVDPVQTHLTPSGQQVITIPAKELLNNEGIGKAFKRVGNGYPLEKGATAYVYERTRPFTYDEMMDFISKYYVSYPQWKGIYDTSLFIPYSTGSISLGDVWGKLDIEDDGTLYGHPGESRPTTITWTLNGINELLISSVRNTCSTADGVDVTISDMSGRHISSHIENNGSSSLDVRKFNNMLTTLTIDKHGNPSCDSIMIVKK